MKIIERGWRAHLCVGNKCRFGRNTLVGEYPKCIIVSTVGNYWPNDNSTKPETIGFERYYETYMFAPEKEGVYVEACAHKQIPFDGKWSIGVCDESSDNEANDMHEAAIQIAIKMIDDGTFKAIVENNSWVW